jgi:ankyrin repeat protein
LQYVAELRSYATHDPVVVRYLLDQGANPNLGPEWGYGVGATPAFTQVSDSGATLQSAAQYGNIESFDLLLAHGAILSNAATMHAAAEGENIKIMVHLLKLGVDVDQTDGMRMSFPCYDSPLLRAIRLGKPQAVRFLLDHGANTSTKLSGPGWGEFEGMTAIDFSKTDGIKDEIQKIFKEVCKKR